MKSLKNVIPQLIAFRHEFRHGKWRCDLISNSDENHLLIKISADRPGLLAKKEKLAAIDQLKIFSDLIQSELLETKFGYCVEILAVADLEIENMDQSVRDLLMIREFSTRDLMSLTRFSPPKLMRWLFEREEQGLLKRSRTGAYQNSYWSFA